MARPTRQQRRARREAEMPARDRAARQVAPPAARPEQARRRLGPLGFIGESAGELKKVDWPKRPQVIQGTIVVIIACAIVGGYLFAADVVLRRFVETVLLGS